VVELTFGKHSTSNDLTMNASHQIPTNTFLIISWSKVKWYVESCFLMDCTLVGIKGEREPLKAFDQCASLSSIPPQLEHDALYKIAPM
jgi:hypothetical protein